MSDDLTPAEALIFARIGDRDAARHSLRLFCEAVERGEQPDPALLAFVAKRIREADEKDDPRWIYGAPAAKGRRERSLADCEDEIDLAALVLERCEGDLERVGFVCAEFDRARERAIEDGKAPAHVAEFFPSGQTARRAFNRWGAVLATFEGWKQQLADAEPPEG